MLRLHSYRRLDEFPAGSTVFDFQFDPQTSVWLDGARCVDVDVDFFSDGSGAIAEAKELCAECPARRQCLEHARAFEPEFGVWGGLTAREIRGLSPLKSRSGHYLRNLTCLHCQETFRAPEANRYCSLGCKRAAYRRRGEQRKASA